MHADMVGHEIDDEPEIVRLERLAQSCEAGFAAELGIELAVVDGVVAMGRALAGLHHRRSIEVRDPQRLEIGHDRGGLVEVEKSAVS